MRLRRKTAVLLGAAFITVLAAGCAGKNASAPAEKTAVQENTQAGKDQNTAAETGGAEAKETKESKKSKESKETEGYLVDTLKLEGGTDWGAPSPFLNASRGPGTAKMNLVFASLIDEDENGDIPWLAESWTIEGNDYTFTLYPDTAFHDGEPLTTEDVAFSIDYYKEHTPVSNYLGTGDSFIVDHYSIVDDRTITITVKESMADTLTNVGSFVIIPKHVWEKVEDPNTYTGDGYLTGSGAYMCTAYDGATGSYELTAFDGFKGGKPAAGRVLFVPVSDPLLAFENGEIDITSMPADLKDRYAGDSSIGIVEKANDMGYKLLINFEKCPDFLDTGLRKALYAALDRQAVVDKVFRGAGSVGSAGYVPEGSIYYNDKCVRYEYDPETAKAAFDGKGIEVTLLAADSGDDVAIAELIKLNLEAAGVKVNVAAYDSATRDDMVNGGDYELALVGNGGWGNNPPKYMRTIFSDKSKNQGGNPHSMGPIGYSNEEITKLAEDQMYEVDFEARKQMFKDLEALVSEEVPLIVVANKSSYSMYRKDYFDGWMKTYAYQQAEQNRLSFMER
ncbi:peptide ABC transporter substrate-binding protein [Clostridium sp. MCC353]|uniref:ABC transporter substrate-binding protein n=1 Tax=Clostridium sp. MCC353 TaxID=2592646 RepID=UPI001C036685|nr:ABC transporter substrate-binding protein [Clostridium sp. MCC353]MBT9775723.1 peptide ABC transporter substrate-binding protein [Clostridium sp. MCC353]